VGLRRDVLDAEDLEAGGLDRPDRRLATGARTFDEDLDLLQAVARPGVGLRALAVDREPAAVADAPVGADLAEPLDRLRAVAAQVALDLEVLVDVLAELGDLLVGQVLDLGVEP
jgi:hypothetical protein